MARQGWRAAVVGGLALTAIGSGSAQALTLPPGWNVMERAGIRTATVPAGATRVQAVVVGARGGGAMGGRPAGVSGEFAVAAGQTLFMSVGSEGRLRSPAVPDVLGAGTGGGSSWIRLCPTLTDRCVNGSFTVVAGGGGSGAGDVTIPGGAGGDAGAPGASGSPTGLAGGGGSTGAPATGGAAGIVPARCLDSVAGGVGRDGRGMSGGDGGDSDFIDLEGGGGGDGAIGGGGGGSAAGCDSAQGSGGGGAGGTNLVPPGGTAELVAPGTAGPQVRYSFVMEATAPAIAVGAPVDGGSYAARSVVAAACSCTDEAGGSGIESCTGTVAAGQPIDTATPGRKTFTVTARDRLGNTATKTVSYTVTAPPPPAIAPRVRGIAVSARAIRFTLSAPARVTLRFERRKPGRRVRWAPVGTLRRDGRRGANTVALRGRVGRRKLGPGSYRVVLVATANGRRSTATRAFMVRAPRRRS